ncbi:hypothetical protein AB5I41_28635 [Sphingomonas sp. MMS24-JH45]
MAAMYRLKGIGWLGSVAVAAIGFYLVSSQVAAERKKLEQIDRKIVVAERDIRALETEFDVRANLAQLERWNGDTLALTVPVAGQFVSDEAALAQLSPRRPMPLGGEGEIRTAQLLVPAAPVLPTLTPIAAPIPVPVTISDHVPAPARVQTAAVAPRPAAAPLPRIVKASVATASASTRPAAIRPASLQPAAMVQTASTRPRNLRAVAMLDKSLLSHHPRRAADRRPERGGPFAVTTLVARPVRPQRANDQRQAALATQHTRLMVLMLLFGGDFLVIDGRLAMLGVLEGGAAGRRAAATSPRGDIVDRNGAPLARTIDAWTIGVHPDRLIGDAGEIAQKLADLMPDKGDQAYFYAQITKPVSFTYLNRRASPALVEAVNAIGEPGIVFERETQRLLIRIRPWRRTRWASSATGTAEWDRARARRSPHQSRHCRHPRRAVDRRAGAGGDGERTRPLDGGDAGPCRGGHRPRRPHRRDRVDGLDAAVQPEPRRHGGHRPASQHGGADRSTNSDRRSSRSPWRSRSTAASSAT